MHDSSRSLRSVVIVIDWKEVNTMAKSAQRGKPFQIEAMCKAQIGLNDMSKNTERKRIPISSSGDCRVIQEEKYRKSTRNHLVCILLAYVT